MNKNKKNSQSAVNLLVLKFLRAQLSEVLRLSLSGKNIHLQSTSQQYVPSFDSYH